MVLKHLSTPPPCPIKDNYISLPPIMKGDTRIPKGEGNWNYGKPKPETQKKQMSKSKLGPLHPKFKGWYQKDNNLYASAREAHEAYPRYSGRSITRYSKQNLYGWSFIPKGAVKQFNDMQCQNKELSIPTI